MKAVWIKCSIFKADQYTPYGEYYALGIDKKGIYDKNSYTYWDVKNSIISLSVVVTPFVVLALEFHTLPHPTSNPYDRFFIEALCGFAKDTRNYPYLWNRFFAEKQPFYKYPLKPLAPQFNLLKNTTFSNDQKTSLSHIIAGTITIPTMSYQFLRAMNPILIPMSACALPSLICSYFFPIMTRTFSVIAVIIGCLWFRGNLSGRKPSWKSRMYACNDWYPRSIQLLG